MEFSFDSIINSLKELKVQNINEAQTKDWLIRPFFESLGWDFSNPIEIIPEDDDSAGKRTDYCFYINKLPKVLVEAKKLSNTLTDNKMIMEKLNYCTNRGISLLIITNGDSYKIYYSELKGIGKDKLLQEFTLSDSIDEDIIEKLTKQSFENDLLLNYARNISLFTTVKKAVEKIFHSSDKKFIRLVNESVKEILGHKFGDDDIKRALNQFSLNINSDLLEASFEDDNQEDRIDDKKIWTIEHQFKDGRWGESQEYYSKLINVLKSGEINFIEHPTKRYISLLFNNKSFCQICGLKSGLKFWINLEMEDLSEEETLKVRDVSNIGHWGMGDIECFIINGSEIEWVINLINKSYKKLNTQAGLN
jgi:hypothetical protein